MAWNILNSPFIIELSDVLAVIRPRHIREWKEDLEVEASRRANQSKLEKWELLQDNTEKLEDQTSDEVVKRLIKNV